MPNFNFNMFQRNAKKNVQKSMKDLTHEWKHDIPLGFLIPCLMVPTLPGDDFTIRSQFFFKCEPLYFPIIHRLNMVVDYFWVRNGAMWPTIFDGTLNDEGWENWIMMRDVYEHPTVDVDMRWYESGTLNDSVMGYFGIPYLMYEDGVRTTTITGLNAFPPMAYLMIYDQYYRHPQLEEEAALFKLTQGDNTVNITAMYGHFVPGNDVRLSVFPAKWGKDYLTSCLPTPQAGDPVQIPVVDPSLLGTSGPRQWNIEGTGNPIGGGTLQTDAGGDTQVAAIDDAYLDVQQTAGTIRDLSIASVLQTLKEQLMKVGQRYKDWIDFSHNEDIDPLDINVPLMIGSYRGSVQISDVLTQANTTVGENDFTTGDYTGNASLYEQDMNAIRFNCRDYGVLMAIMTVTPNTGYGQGINRYWRYADPLDYPLDIFTTVGDQEVRKEEAMYNNVTADAAKNDETFGYIPRYAEASFINNNYGTNLLFNAGLSVHLGKWYDPDFVKGTEYDDNIEINLEYLRADQVWHGGTRVRDAFKVLTLPNGLPTMNPVIAYVLHEIRAMRPLPQFSTPSL